MNSCPGTEYGQDRPQKHSITPLPRTQKKKSENERCLLVDAVLHAEALQRQHSSGRPKLHRRSEGEIAGGDGCIPDNAAGDAVELRSAPSVWRQRGARATRLRSRSFTGREGEGKKGPFLSRYRRSARCNLACFLRVFMAVQMRCHSK